MSMVKVAGVIWYGFLVGLILMVLSHRPQVHCFLKTQAMACLTTP